MPRRAYLRSGRLKTEDCLLKKGGPYLKTGQTNDRSTKGTSDIVYAMKDIDFKVEQGDVVGRASIFQSFRIRSTFK